MSDEAPEHAGDGGAAAPAREPAWYQKAVFYEVLVRGFYDGVEEASSVGGGASLGTWRVRLCPNAPGTWRYEIESSEPALAGESGTVDCVPNANPPAQIGPPPMIGPPPPDAAAKP